MKKGILQNFAKFTGKHLCQSLFFNNVADLRLQLKKKRDSDTYFPVNFEKFLRTPILKNISWQLLIKYELVEPYPRFWKPPVKQSFRPSAPNPFPLRGQYSLLEYVNTLWLFKESFASDPNSVNVDVILLFRKVFSRNHVENNEFPGLFGIASQLPKGLYLYSGFI